MKVYSITQNKTYSVPQKNVNVKQYNNINNKNSMPSFGSWYEDFKYSDGYFKLAVASVVTAAGFGVLGFFNNKVTDRDNKIANNPTYLIRLAESKTNTLKFNNGVQISNFSLEEFENGVHLKGKYSENNIFVLDIENNFKGEAEGELKLIDTKKKTMDTEKVYVAKVDNNTFQGKLGNKNILVHTTKDKIYVYSDNEEMLNGDIPAPQGRHEDPNTYFWLFICAAIASELKSVRNRANDEVANWLS